MDYLTYCSRKSVVCGRKKYVKQRKNKIVMKKMMKTIILCLVCLLPSVAMAQSDTVSTKKVYNRGWYAGLQGGVAYGVNTFSSFGNDKTNTGWTGGIYVGYIFNSLISLEANASLGQMTLSERECCNERGYFLGTDWKRYKYVPAGMAGYYYSDLESDVFMQRYGLKLNFNVLGLFNRTRDSRWRFELSPAVYAVGTNADISQKENGEAVAEDVDNWHIGLGGSAALSFAITNNLNLGIYGGCTFLTGPKVMDGMPELHHDNYIVDGGLRLAWHFGAKRQVKQPVETAPVVIIEHKVDTVYIPQPVKEPVVEEVKEIVVKDEDETDPTTLDERFPIVYFRFNSIWVDPKERKKIREIADLMRNNKDMRVKITGWGCKIGGEEVNKRVSLQRAKAVKTELVRLMIPASRIEVEGLGIKHDVQKNSDARITTTREIKK